MLIVLRIHLQQATSADCSILKKGDTMVYVVVKQSPMYKQMNIEDLLFGSVCDNLLISKNIGNTKTYCLEELPEKLHRAINKGALINKLKEFNQSVDHLRTVDRAKLYYSFLIPKKTGGTRRIDAPNPELMDALRGLKTLFETSFGAKVLYHTSAFAYIEGRSTIDAVKRHQANESRWYAKFDLSNFFGNTTMEFTMQQLSMIFPFSEIIKIPEGRAELEKALDLAFLNGGLPQGTPISPLITNIIMIPIDFKLKKALRDFDGKYHVYTRYADDFIISSRYDFNFRNVEKLIADTIVDSGAKFRLKPEKTRYGSTAGRNFNLGLMVTSENRITIGNAKKRQIEMLMRNYAIDVKNGNRWDISDVQVFAGQLSYLRMVEPDVFERIVQHINGKFSIDIMSEIKADLK